MKDRQPGKVDRSAGFTLMEVLIAITIFSVCVSAVYLLYSSVISVVENVEKGTGMDREARVTLDRLLLDINGMHMGEQGFLTASEPVDQQDGEPFLELTSSSHLVLDPDENPVDIAVVRYYLASNDDDDGYTLVRSDTAMTGRLLSEAPEGVKHILAVDVAGLKIVYVDEEGEEAEVWQSEPDDDTEDAERRFPRAFFITLQLQEPGGADSRIVEYKEAVVVPQMEYEFEDES